MSDLSLTDTAIANRALLSIGHSDTLTNLTSDDSKAAKVIRAVYSDCIDEVLQAYDWNFATGRAQLPQADDTPAFDFPYQYPLPDDCLQVRELQANSRTIVWIRTTGYNACWDDGLERWRVEINGDTEETFERVLLCDLPSPVNVVYTRRITTLSRWTPLARRALIALIGAEIALPIAQKSSLAVELRKVYDDVIGSAGSRDAQEASETELDPGSWVRARE
jgi:hypothetical protein